MPVVASDTLRVSCLKAPPFIYETDEKDVTGILVEFLKASADQVNLVIEFELVNWKRAQAHVKEGQTDLLMPTVFTKERTTWLEYHQTPLTKFEFSIFKHKDDSLEFKGDMRIFEGQDIGKIRAGKMHPLYNGEEAKGYFNVVERNSLELLVKGVEYKRLKYFVTPKEMALWIAKKNDYLNVVPMEPAIGSTPIFLPISRNSKKIEAWLRLHKQIEINQKNGFFDSIKSAYLE